MKHPHYLNGMLITNSEKALVFQRIGEKGLETVKELPEGKDLTISLWIRSNLNNFKIKETYCRRHKGTEVIGVFRLDLENLELSELKQLKHYYVRHFYPEMVFAFDHDHDEKNNYWIKKVYRLKDGKSTFLKEFKDVNSRIGTHISRAGIVCKQKGKVRVYVFPDLKEMKFKKLN